MSDLPESEQHLTLALFRYRLIAEAIDAERGERAGILRSIAAAEHMTPTGEALTRDAADAGALDLELPGKEAGGACARHPQGTRARRAR